MGLSKIVPYGLLLFVFLLPLQTVYLWREPFIGGEKWQYGTIGAYAIDILLVTLLAFIFIKWLRDCSKKYQVSRISYAVSRITRHLSLILLLIWAGISVFWAPDHLLAGYFFLKVSLGAAVFLIARSCDTDIIKKVIFTVLLAGVLQGGIGIAQFLSQQSLSATILGMSAHEAWQAGSSVLKIDQGRFLRAYGTFPHPNMLGGFLAVVFVSGVAYHVFCMRKPAENEESKRPVSFITHHVSSVLYLSSLVVILLGLILAFSRTAWLGAGIGIAILSLWHFLATATRKLRPSFSGILGKTVGVLGVAGIVFGAVLHEQIMPRFDPVTIEREKSVSERAQSYWDAGVVLGKGNMLLGTGLGNFTAALLKIDPERPVWTVQPVHNMFVLILTELGVIGLFLFLIFIGTLLPSHRKSNIISRPWNYVTFFGEERIGRVIFGIAVLTLVPSLLLDHWLWTSHFGLFFFLLLLGLSQSKDGE